MCMRGSKKKTWEKNTEMKEAELLFYALESSSQVSAYKLSNAQRAGVENVQQLTSPQTRDHVTCMITPRQSMRVKWGACFMKIL